MSTHPRTLARLLAAGFLILGVAMVAEARPKPKTKESAQALLNKGNKAFAAGDYAAALEAFQQGNAAAASPAFQRSIGYAHLKLYQHEKARAALQEYLKLYPKEADAKTIQETVGKLEVVVQTKISVTSTPPGADLYIDAEAAGKVATTPRADLTIYPGKHVLVLKLSKYHTTVKPFVIAPKQSLNLDVAMEAPLVVDSVPTGAQVFIDSEKGPAVGVTRFEGGIGPGKHTVIIKMAGYKSKVLPVEVKPPEPVTVGGTLGLGIRVVSTPAGGSVEINGKRLEGVTPVEESLAPGDYKVTITRAGYKPYRVTKRVEAGSDNLVDAKLQGGLLTMRTDVDGAKVAVDGRELGSTPTDKATVPFGRHQVQVTHPDRRAWSDAVDFQEGNMVDAQVKLGRPMWPFWTAAAATGAGVLMMAIGGGLAMKNRSDWNNKGYCNDWGSPTDAGKGAGVTCSTGMPNLATAGSVIAGTGLVTALVYYFVWARSSADVRRIPVTAASSQRPRRTAAAPAR